MGRRMKSFSKNQFGLHQPITRKKRLIFTQEERKKREDEAKEAMKVRKSYRN